MATPNSQAPSTLPRPANARRAPGSYWKPLGTVAIALGMVACLATEPGINSFNQFASNALNAYQEARRQLDTAPSNSVLGWQFARACFDWAEYATNDTQRASLAEEGIGVSRGVVTRDPQLPAASYYLAMNLGQLARTRSLGALKLVSEMENCFHLVRRLDERFDFAGADRCLGLLYRDAPGWPISVGSRSKARRHLTRAVAVSPEYPDNRLNLIEALLQWGEREEAREAARAARDPLAKARRDLVGAKWEPSWVDWDGRWRRVVKATGLPEPTAAVSP